MATYSFTTTSVAVPFVAAFADRLPILLNSNKQFDKEFKAGNGTSINILIPDHPDVATGAAISASNYASGSVTLSLTQYNVSIDATQVIRALDIHDFKGQVAEPYGAKLASEIQKLAAQEIQLKADTQYVLSTANFAGVAGAIAGIRKARSYGNLFGVLDPSLSATVAGAGTSLFLPSSISGDLHKEARLGRFHTAEFFDSPDVKALTTGTLAITGADLAVDGALTAGATTLTLDATGLVGTVKKGQGFTIAGVNAVDIYGVDTGKPYVFVAQADATAAANEIEITIKPIYTAANNKALANVSAYPADGASATQLQESNSSYLCGIIWDKMALAFGSANLAPISNTTKTMEDPAAGLSCSVTRGPDIAAGKEVVRWDVLVGFKLIRSNWATVVWFKV